MSGAGDRGKPKSFEIPDLDLPPPRASQSSLKAVVPPESGRGPASGTERAIGLGMDDELEVASSDAALALDLEGPISAAGVTVSRSVSQEALFENEGFELEPVRPTQKGITVAPEGRPNWPTGVTVPREQLKLDPLEVRLLAGYGEPASVGPLNALYALRVTLRRQALTTALRVVERELLLAEAARDAELAALAERKLPELRSSEVFRRHLSALTEVESLANERTRALSATNEEQAAEVARLDAELSGVQRELETERAEQRELERQLDAREQTRSRVEARYKRYFIDMRAIEQQAAQRLGPAGGEMPPELHAQLAPLKAQADALKPELDAARAAAEGSRAELETRRKIQKELERREREIDRRKAQLRERFQPQLSARQQGVGELATKRKNALADIGRAVLAARGGVDVDGATLGSLRRADEKVFDLAKKSQLHLVALDSCDDSKVKVGFFWLFGTLALILAYVVYRASSAATS